MADEADFVTFVRSRGPALLRTAAFLGGGPAEGEDLLQHALASAYARYGRLRDPAALEAYVRVTLLRTAVSWRQRAWRRRETLRADPPEGSARSDVDTVLDRAALWPLLRQLSPRQRVVVVLRYYEDMSELEFRLDQY